MDLNESVNILAVRLYDWAVRDFTRELEQNCPLLSLIADYNRNVAAFTSWNDDLSTDERRLVAITMTLMFHNNARNLLEKAVTPEMEHWAEQFYEQTTTRLDAMPPLL